MRPFQPETVTTQPWVQYAYGAAIGVAALWLATDVFVRWRRGATNLTPVAAARKNAGAQADFLSVDREARAEALERADAYEAELAEREARAAAEAAAREGRRVGRMAGYVSLFMAFFTLASMIATAVWQVTWIGTVWERYSTGERLKAVLSAHPFAFAVAITVIAYHVHQFVSARKWRVAA